VCDRERNESQKQTAHCYTNHSINTVPACSCPPPSTCQVHSDIIQFQTSKCAYDKTSCNITTFTINDVDNNKQPTCIVRYTAVENSSVVYSEEQFVVNFLHSMDSHANEGSLQTEIIPAGESGKQI